MEAAAGEDTAGAGRQTIDTHHPHARTRCLSQSLSRRSTPLGVRIYLYLPYINQQRLLRVRKAKHEMRRQQHVQGAAHDRCIKRLTN
jgi:hypothetical protein